MWRYTPFIIPILISGTLSLGISIFAGRRRTTPGATPLAVLALAVAIWSFGSVIEISSRALLISLLGAQIEYVGIVAAPVAWLIFGLRYTHRDRRLTRRALALLMIIPALTLLFVWTNDRHGLIWSAVGLASRGAPAGLAVEHGPWFWIHTAYSYLCLLGGTTVIGSALLRTPHLYRRQAGVLMIGVVAPWIGNIAYLSGLSPWPGLDLTPFGLTVTVLALAWDMLRLGLLDVVPVARDLLVERMSDGVVVLDADNRIVDLNAAALKEIRRPVAEVIGHSAEVIFARWPDLLTRYRGATDISESIALADDPQKRVMDVRLSALYDQRGILTGRLIVWRDITARASLETALRESEATTRALLAALPDLLLRVDRYGKVFDFKPPHGGAFVLPDPFDVHHIRDVFPPSIAQELLGRLAAALDDDSIPIWEYQIELVTGLHDREARVVRFGDDEALVLIRDITERKRAEAALRASEEKLRALFEILPIGVAIVDNQRNIVEANPALSRIFDVAPGDQAGLLQERFTFIGPSGAPLTEEDMPSAMAISDGRVLQGSEIGIIGADGQVIWTSISAAPIPIEGLGAVVVTSDITESKRREERLHRLNARLLFHVQETPLGYIEWDQDTHVVSWNPAAERIFGYTASEVLGRSIGDLILPSRIKEDINELERQLLSRAGGTRSTNPNLTKDGREIICEWYNTPIIERDGSVSGWASLVQDISDQVQMQQALRQANDTLQARIDELSTLNRITQTVVAQTDLSDLLMTVAQQMAELLDASGTLIVLLNDDGTKLTFAADYDRDPRARNFVGASIDIGEIPFAMHMIAAHQSLLVTQPQINQLLSLFDPLPRAERYECLLLVPLIMRGVVNGAIILTSDQHRCSFSAGEIRLAETIAGQVAGVIEHAKLLDVAQRARAAAEAASRAKSQFLGSVSHELRTPLNAILGYAQLLQYDQDLSAQQQESLQIIRQSGDHLLTLITDLLDLAKIEAGRIELSEEPLDLAAFLADVAAMARLWAQHKALGFEFAIAHAESDAALPARVRADPRRLRQVLLNLLGNAVKFTDAGSVTLSVNAIPGSRYPDRRLIRFQIEDTGVGIAASDLKAIFAPFQQVGDPRRRAEGAGLGLAICVELLHMMGSELQVRSELDAGSLFWFDLELPELIDKVYDFGVVARPAQRLDGSGLTALIAEDDRESRALLRDLLAPLGFTVIEATDGREALERALARRPDVLIADVMMPELDGIALTRAIRQTTQLSDVIVVMISANAGDEQRRACIEAGAHVFIAKPIALDHLLDTLQQLLGVVGSAGRPPADADEIELASPFLAPPQDELARLYDLALVGDVRAIRQRAEALADGRPECAPFARTIQRMAKAFQIDAIRKLLQTYQTVADGVAVDDASQHDYSDRR